MTEWDALIITANRHITNHRNSVGDDVIRLSKLVLELKKRVEQLEAKK